MKITKLYRSILLTALCGTLLLAACGNKPTTPPSDKPLPNSLTRSNSAVKLIVDSAGVYSVALDDLKNIGLTIDTLDVTNLNLTQNGATIPYLVEGDHLIFYGQSSESRYNSSHPYILRQGEAGTAMTQTTPPQPTGALLTAIPQMTRVEENWVYEQRAAEIGADVWYWKKVLQSGEESKAEFTIDLPEITGDSAEIVMQLWGFTKDNSLDPDHDFDLLINDQLVSSVTFDGDVVYIAKAIIPRNILKKGENKITLDNSKPGNAFVDQFFVDWIEFNYTTPTSVQNESITLSQTEGQVALTGYSSQPLLLDITNPATPSQLTGWAYGSNVAQFGINPTMVVTAVGEKGYKTPQVKPLLTNSWNDQADLIIITTAELAPALQPLIEARKAQGLTVGLAQVEEIYDQYGYGDPSPQSINNFIKFAYAAHDKKPQYVFLVGDATTDPLGYESNRPNDPVTPPSNIVPSELIKVSFSGETVSDARLVDIDGNLTPDIAVGRWPLNTVKEVENLVTRTLAYEKGLASEPAIFSFDPSGAGEFGGFTNRLIDNTGFDKSHVVLYDEPDSTNLLKQWNDGAWMISYVGHGSLAMWGKDELFSVDKINSISGDKNPPIVMQFSCLTGQFAHPSVESLSETMLKHEGGPVLLIAATSLTLSSNQSPFAVAFVKELQNPESKRIGDALQKAKIVLNNNGSGAQEISDTFGLIGDPSALIARPAYAVQNTTATTPAP